MIYSHMHTYVYNDVLSSFNRQFIKVCPSTRIWGGNIGEAGLHASGLT